MSRSNSSNFDLTDIDYIYSLNIDNQPLSLCEKLFLKIKKLFFY